MRNFFRCFIFIDQTSDQFNQPRVGDLAHRTNAKLLDQHHFVTHGVVRQHAHRIVAHKQLATDLAAHAASEQFVAQANPIELVKALEAVHPLDDFNVRGHRFKRV
ncbi:hypothetical protein D3C72_1879790 [compost metagenome]